MPVALHLERSRNLTQESVVHAAHDALSDAIASDTEIALEAARHSTWITAFCAGGMALLVNRGQDWLEASSLTKSWGVFALALVALFFSAAAIAGALAYRRLRRGAARKREARTFIGLQRAVMLAHLSVPEETGEISLPKIWALGYLDSETQARYQEVSAKDEADQSELGLIPFQETFALFGYLGMAAMVFATL